MGDSGSSVGKILKNEKVEYRDCLDDKIEFLLSANDVDRIEMVVNKPVFSAEITRDKSEFRRVMEQLNIPPEKWELIYW